MLVDKAQALALARRQQLNRIIGDRRAGRHARKLTARCRLRLLCRAQVGQASVIMLK